jgi:Kef-type K+ transport system membrane component KefB
MNQVLCIALALLVGLLSSRLMKLIHLPNVTGYLIAGIIFGPYVLGPYISGWSVDGANQLSAISWISDLALGFIAFTIGCSFSLSSLKQTGKRAVIITCFESFGGGLCVLAVLFAAWGINSALPNSVIDIPLPFVLVVSAIACATAPAATLLVIKQYKAKGPVCDTLLPVVALDDATALIAYAILFSVAQTVDKGTGLDLIEVLLIPVLEIVFSLLMGAILGFGCAFATRFFKSRGNRLSFCMVAILVVVGVSNLPIVVNGYTFAFSPLLACMASGAIFINMAKDPNPTLVLMDRFTVPLYILFFVISGANLNIKVFADAKLGPSIAVIASLYVLSRSGGKWLGAFAGAKITKSDPNVQKYLGFTLLPQAGVAIGLATSAARSFSNPEIGSLILACILTTTLLYELFGPVITKVALTKAGEIVEEPKTPKNPTPSAS